MTSVYKVLMRAAFVVGCVVGSSACGTVDDAQTESTQDVVTTNLTTYMQGQNIVVT
jgi:PBP1b-binding outer membrane lipoprotein LpoB